MSDKRKEAATAIANRLGIAPSAAQSLAAAMTDGELAKLLSADRQKERPDQAVKAVVDAMADRLEQPQEVELPCVLKDGEWVHVEEVEPAAHPIRADPITPSSNGI